MGRRGLHGSGNFAASAGAGASNPDSRGAPMASKALSIMRRSGPEAHLPLHDVRDSLTEVQHEFLPIGRRSHTPQEGSPA